MSNLCSPRLQFTRDARRVVGATATGLAIHEVGSSTRLAIDAPAGVCSLAAFADQVWATSATELVRWDLRGRTIGAPIAIANDTHLVPALAGPAAATLADHLWLGGGERTDALSQIACGADVLPFVGKRTVEVARYRGERVARLGAAAWRLPGATQLVAAAPLFDGTGIVLFVRTAERAEAWTSTLTGAIHHVVALPAGELRLAARAGIAIVQTAPDAAVAFDLRYGRRIGDAALDGAAVDLAIDPDGKYLAHTDAHGELAITTLHDALKTANHNRYARIINNDNDDHGDDNNDPGSEPMSDMDEAIEATEPIREGADTAMGLANQAGANIPGGGLLGMVNNGATIAKGVSEMDKGDAVGGGLDVASGVAGGIGKAAEFGEEVAGESAGLGKLGTAAGAVAGGFEVGKGAYDIATDEGYGGKTMTGIEEALKGGADIAGSGVLGPEGKALGAAFKGGMQIGDAIAPTVFGDMKNTGSHMETVPEDGVFHASTGNSVVDWVAGVGKYTDGRF